MRRRLTAIVGLAIATALVVSMYAVPSGGAGSEAVSAAPTPVATLTTRDFRVVVTAEKAGNGGAPAAAVTVATSRRIDDR